MTECPYCHQKAMSELAKSWLGPARSTKCKSCGKKVSVSWYAMLETALILPAVMVAFNLGSIWLAAIPLLLGMAAALWVHSRWIRLVPRGV